MSTWMYWVDGIATGLGLLTVIAWYFSDANPAPANVAKVAAAIVFWPVLLCCLVLWGAGQWVAPLWPKRRVGVKCAQCRSEIPPTDGVYR